MFTHPEIKEEILYSFQYGSKVYGTNTENSDDDFIVVVKSEEELEYGVHNDEENITVYSEKTFKRLIEEHDIAVLECIFSKETDFVFQLNLEKLRRSISSVASNSFVKCKKKLIEGKDYNPYIGKKSLFHSLRILDFGIQIAKYGKIIDFSSSNRHFWDIMNIKSNDWEVFKEKYQPIANALKTEFKKLAPLEKDTHNKEW